MSQSSFLKNLNETLNQPGVVASCASIGFHVLLYAALPGLPIAYQQVNNSSRYSNPEGESNPDVGLIELNTAEISRIPDLSVPIAPAPPLLADTPPLPNIDQLLPQRPLTRNIPNVPPPSALPSIPPNPIALAPRLGTRPRRNNTRTFSPGLPPPPAISLNPPRRRSVTINPNGAAGIPQPPSPEEAERRQQLPFDNPNPSSIGRVVPNLTIPSGLPGQTPPTPPGAPNLPTQPPENNNNNSTPPQTNSPGQTAARPPSAGLEVALQRIARLQEEEFKQKDENTSEKDYRDNTLEWESEVAQNTNRQEVKRQDISIRGNYPNAACRLRNQNAVTVNIGFVVSPQGSASNLTILQSSGRPILDQQARSQVASRGYSNSTGQPVPYHASVNFTPPENCGGFVNEPANESEGETIPQAQTPTPPPEKSPVQAAPAPEPETPAPEPSQLSPEPEVPAPEPVQAEPAPEPVQAAPEPAPPAPEPVQLSPEPALPTPEPEPPAPEPVQVAPEPAPPAPEPIQVAPEPETPAPEPVQTESEGEAVAE